MSEHHARTGRETITLTACIATLRLPFRPDRIEPREKMTTQELAVANSATASCERLHFYSARP
ncbi:hypothetical protein NTGM5_260062 [Candidatus Nitrotoga sp. M5]|nr:hypothetical protein NTGM5_260062 [Candidatus Nitrotoga sp. M5]